MVGLGPEVQERPVREVSNEPEIHLGAGFPDFDVRIDESFYEVEGLVARVVGWVPVIGQGWELNQILEWLHRLQSTHKEYLSPQLAYGSMQTRLGVTAVCIP